MAWVQPCLVRARASCCIHPAMDERSCKNPVTFHFQGCDGCSCRLAKPFQQSTVRIPRCSHGACSEKHPSITLCRSHTPGILCCPCLGMLLLQEQALGSTLRHPQPFRGEKVEGKHPVAPASLGSGVRGSEGTARPCSAHE